MPDHLPMPAFKNPADRSAAFKLLTAAAFAVYARFIRRCDLYSAYAAYLCRAVRRSTVCSGERLFAYNGTILLPCSIVNKNIAAEIRKNTGFERIHSKRGRRFPAAASFIEIKA
jgi:hypothetical protein